MKKTLFAALVLLLTGTLTAFSADKETRTLNVNAFDAISCNIPCDIKYETGEPKVILYADSNVLDNITVEVVERELRIRMPEKRLRNIKGATIYITSNILNSLACNGACEFENKNGIRTNKAFSMTCNGACDCEIASIRTSDITVAINGVGDCELKDIHCKTINATINGAGSLELGGKCTEANLTINGAGGIDIEDLFAERVNSSIHGAGSISRD